MGFGKKRSNKVGVGAITTNKKKLFAEGGMMDDGKNVDPVSGNDVPVGSLAEEVRDDVDAKLSPGEFVFPADVVRFIGLERLMQMRDQAKKGLMRMNDIGQMGNAEEAGDKADDTYEEGEEDDNFESDIDEIIKEVDQEETGRQTQQAFNTGGFVNQSYYDLTKAPKNPALDIRYFKDSAGKDFYMPFINGKPMKPMPNGAIQSSGPPPKTTTDKEPDRENVGGKEIGVGIGGGAASGIVGGITTSTTGTQQQQISDSQNAGASSGIAGVYTGQNLADFGRADMIYNPGGSGPGGELMQEDLYSGVNQSQVNIATTIGSAIASAMGVPGIATLPARIAIRKFGADTYNKWAGERNQALAAMASGVDVNTPEGKAAAASQIDQIQSGQTFKRKITFGGQTRISEYTPQPAATSGAIGTGSVAAQASSAVATSLTGTGLSDKDIGELSQRAADAVIRGTDINTAVNDAKTAAVDVIQEKFSDAFGLANVTKEDIKDAVFGNVRGTEELAGAQVETPDLSKNLPAAEPDISSTLPKAIVSETVAAPIDTVTQDFASVEDRMTGRLDDFGMDSYNNDMFDSFDFWGSDSDALFGDFGGWSGGGGGGGSLDNFFRPRSNK